MRPEYDTEWSAMKAVAAKLGIRTTETEALRLLRRRISDRGYRALLADQADLGQPLNPLPPTPMSLAA
ncbi:hypothetical protein [Streptomyces sp. KR55]|uniref:hypothetical protein n=1 Tax=Streptomyces sp. KR55 TaxID=3457425 RepID=UPI003FD5F2B1